jgi:hypothetical protein
LITSAAISPAKVLPTDELSAVIGSLVRTCTLVPAGMTLMLSVAAVVGTAARDRAAVFCAQDINTSAQSVVKQAITARFI